MLNLGKVQPGSTIYIPFDTFAGSTGAPITITGLATSDIQIYKDGGTTQRASASGITLLDTDGIDFDGITGIHGFSIDLSDNTTADFYASGSRYFVVVSTITVDSQTMSFIAARFMIGEANSILDTTIASLTSQTSFTLTTGPADNNALVGCVAVIHDAASAVQQCFGFVSAYTGASKTVTLIADPGIFTMAAKDNISFLPPQKTNVLQVNGTAQTAGDLATMITAVDDYVDTEVAAIKAKTDNLPSDPADASDIAASFTSVLSKMLKYTQLLARKDAAIATDNATELTAINADGGSGAGAYANTTDALEAVRDRGDAAWTTGGGGSLTDVLNVTPMIPQSVDLADTATVRIGLMLTNAVDDLPSTAEITPGTISIDRKAIGGTSWTSIVADAACSESAGLIYYDEVFDTGTGYAEGDSLRVTFKSQKITVAANDYEVTDTTGRMFYTEIRQTMRGTNSAFLAASAPTNFSALGINGSGHISRVTLTDTVTTYTGNTPQTGDSYARLGAPVGASISNDIAGVQSDTNDLQTRVPAALVSGRIDASVGAMAANTMTASALATDAVSEIQSGLSTLDAAGIRTAVGLTSANLDTQLDAIPTAAENATALLDLSAGVETGLTPRQALRLMVAAVAGKLSGAATTTIVIRNAVADSKDRITATVTSDGNRTAITYDLT